MNEIDETKADELPEPASSSEPAEAASGTSPAAKAVPPPLPPPPPVRPTYPAATRPAAKSPVLAALLGIAIGLGHFYVGVYQRAAIIIISFLLSIYLLPMPLQVFAPIFIWFFSLFDAYRQAQLANLADDQALTPKEGPRGTLVFGVFLTVVGAILLIDELFHIDLEFLRRWWPSLLIIGGIWAIVGALREQRQGKELQRESRGEHAVEAPLPE